MNFYPPAFFGGERSRFQDTHDYQIIGQGGAIVSRVGLAAEDVGQVGDIVVVDGGGDCNAVVVVLSPFYEGPVVQRMEVAGSPEHFPVFDAEWPVPGSLDDACGFGVFEQDGGVVVDLGIFGGFDMMEYGGHGDGGFSVHEPGHEIGAVAAKIAAGAAAIFNRVGEPGEEVGAAANLHRTLVSVVNDHLSCIADGVLPIDHLPDILIRIVPCRLIIGEYVDMVLPGEGCDALRIFNRSGERFFDHDGDLFWRAYLDDAEVFGDGIVGQHGIGMGMVDEFGEGWVEKGIGEMVTFFITGDQLRIGFRDAGDDDLAGCPLVEYVMHMIVRHACNSDA